MSNKKEPDVKIPMSMFLHFKYMVSIVPTEQMAISRKETHEKAKRYAIEKHKKIVSNEAYTCHIKAKDSDKERTLKQYKGVKNSKTGFDI